MNQRGRNKTSKIPVKHAEVYFDLLHTRTRTSVTEPSSQQIEVTLISALAAPQREITVHRTRLHARAIQTEVTFTSALTAGIPTRDHNS